MIGTLPMRALAPLDYRYALDAARTLIRSDQSCVRCDVPELIDEVIQRFPHRSKTPTHGALWIEPLRRSWRATLAALAADLPPGAPLIIIASRPLARLIPERRGWSGDPLGMRLRGITLLQQALTRSGVVMTDHYGIHSLTAIATSMIGQQLDRIGRPDLADRFGFAARLRYCTAGPIRSLSTVALIVARKEAR